MKVEDLDVLRPEARIIRIGGKDIDVSFIPCGITFDVDMIVQELSQMTMADLAENGEKTRRAFDLSVKLCAAFCSHKYPELDEEWFYENADARQIQAFSGAVKEALTRAYAGVENTSKNARAVRVRKRK
jgi:hypothetical protein